ncbi:MULTISPECIES: tRNA 4-thiouridine(8) synthase ThiI [Caldisericum]|jgi:tRNA U34 2-thiouridine synthase MnmA/TrmU|uniref:tRNA 4-thiouridine(8) synthase ThiI n=2 Tax=Caldisericum exile TaxID=693075 RepID=A0A2J6WE84_9BACT|nr:MAG: tRNA 4-thiouridine(8) synthase ThiI [Caldisericum exile]
MAKALVLFSGGIDSQLACLILMKQGIEVVPIFFETYFFKGEKVKRFAEEIGLKLRIEDISEEHLKIVQNPPHGYGKNMNPCIDCHMLMIKKAKEIMEKEGFDFIATGEVLDERPFSQRRTVFEEMEKTLGLEGKIVRPLSQKLLKVSEPELKGIIKREEMLDIRGQSRKIQLKLVKEFGLKEYKTPASGCILTDPEYAKRLKMLKNINPNFDGNDSEILRNGRVLFEGKTIFVVGRNEIENKRLESLRKPNDVMLVPDFPGPSVLIRGFDNKIDEEIINKGKELLLNYSKKQNKDPLNSIKEITGA